MRISDWRSDVCSSDLRRRRRAAGGGDTARGAFAARPVLSGPMARRGDWRRGRNIIASPTTVVAGLDPAIHRSEEHTSELQSLMRISYAVFCLQKKKTQTDTQKHTGQDEHITRRRPT